MMPQGASDSRGQQKSAIAEVYHEKRTSKRLQELVDTLAKLDLNELNEYERANVRDAKRKLDRLIRMPKELAAYEAELTTRGYNIWTKARENNDFESFVPVLQEIVDHVKNVAKITKPELAPYDAAIDEFERGMTAQRLEEIFSQLKKDLKPLMDQILEAKEKYSKTVKEPKELENGEQWDVKQQTEFCLEVTKALGFDLNNGRSDVSVHPFTGGPGPTDVRITTRYSTDNWVEGIAGVIHEVGHALYEQGRNSKYEALPVSEALSMGVHESQSLLWERCVGQSLEFWQYATPVAQKYFPHLKNVTPEQFYYRLNQVQRSLIRVDADEVTYPFHVIIRFEIEKGLMDGTIAVKDLPRIWNAKMKEYLSIDVPSDSKGVLQDVHWSGAAIGYFPSYTLGAMMAVQIFQAAARDIPSLKDDIRQGKFSSLKNWLNTKVHQVGSLYPSPDELLTKVTGEPLNPKYFIEYLRAKYKDIYKF